MVYSHTALGCYNSGDIQMNDKQYSITHILSVLTGGASIVGITAIEGFYHSLNPLYTFLYTSVYATVIGYYAVSLKASASGVTASSVPKAP